MVTIIYELQIFTAAIAAVTPAGIRPMGSAGPAHQIGCPEFGEDGERHK
jgi:hypothetical protein